IVISFPTVRRVEIQTTGQWPDSGTAVQLAFMCELERIRHVTSMKIKQTERSLAVGDEIRALRELRRQFPGWRLRRGAFGVHKLRSVVGTYHRFAAVHQRCRCWGERT